MLGIQEFIETVYEFYSKPDCNKTVYESYLKFVRLLPENVIKGVLGLGFPFYYGVDQEIEGGVKPFLDFIENYRSRANGKFPCFECYQRLGVKDVRFYCKPCEKTDIKPRDIQKIAPDLDVLIIADQDFTGFTENLDGFRPSDVDIYDAVVRIINACYGRGDFPVDLHVAREEDFLDALIFIKENPTLGYQLPVRSYYGEWKDNAKPIGMGTLGTCHYTILSDDLRVAIEVIKRRLREIFPQPEQYLEEMRTVEAIRQRTEDKYLYNRMLGVVERNIYC
ncbi:MAG: hypothetical protein KQA41_03690 [Candidatus Aenigmarchaeota archaeon]|nr:hypothetical protein [Candidatus Aenigmarchaeota archaeon]